MALNLSLKHCCRKELGIPIRVKPVAVVEKKPWEEEEEEQEGEEDGNLIIQLLKNSVRQLPCVKFMKSKMRRKDKIDEEEEHPLKDVERRQSEVFPMEATSGIATVKSTPASPPRSTKKLTPASSPKSTKASPARSRVKDV